MTGGPARVWCTESGRSFQADDVQLVAAVAVPVVARAGLAVAA